MERMHDSHGNEFIFVKRPLWYAGFACKEAGHRCLSGPSFLWLDDRGTFLLARHEGPRWSCRPDGSGDWSDEAFGGSEAWEEQGAVRIERRSGPTMIRYLLYDERWDVRISGPGADLRLPLLLYPDDVLKLDYGEMPARRAAGASLGGFTRRLSIGGRDRAGPVFDFKMPTRVILQPAGRVADKESFQLEARLKEAATLPRCGYSIYLSGNEAPETP